MKRGTAFALAIGGFVAVLVVASVLGGTARGRRWTRAAVRAAAAVVPDAARRGDAKAGAAAWPRAEGGKDRVAKDRLGKGGRGGIDGRIEPAPPGSPAKFVMRDEHVSRSSTSATFFT